VALPSCAPGEPAGAGGSIDAMEPTPEEGDDDQFVHLYRIGFEFNRPDYGRLRQMIDVLNSF